MKLKYEFEIIIMGGIILCCTGGTRWNENKFGVTNKWRNKESYGNPEKRCNKRRTDSWNVKNLWSVWKSYYGGRWTCYS